MDGDPALHQRVIAHANRWLEHANLSFAFGNSPDAEVEVTFAGNRYQSLVGTDAARRPNRDVPSMMLGGFTPNTDDTLMRRTVLHEFGHAIGCIHEQASPVADIPWDVPAVYAHFREWAGWTKEETYYNVLTRYSSSDSTFSEYDPHSIMQYPVPNSITVGDFEIPWNSDLSAGDIAFIAKMYPR